MRTERDVFHDWMRAWSEGWDFAGSMSVDGPRPLEVLAHFEDCQDVLPEEERKCMALPEGGTYADAVQKIRSAEV